MVEQTQQKHPVGPGLRPFLRGVKAGNDKDYRTPFWDGAPRESIRARWDSIFNAKTDTFPGRLEQVEKEQRDKIGPISRRLPLQDRIPEVRAYFNRNWPGVELDSEIDTFLEEFKSDLGRARPLGLENAAEELAGNTNSGYPRFSKRELVREDELEDARSGVWKERPAVLGWRGTASGLEKDPKQRTVWMTPMSSNIREMAFFRPLQKLLLRKAKYLEAWKTPEDVDRAVRKVLEYGIEHSTPIFSTDFSGFDQTAGPPIQRYAFALIKAFYRPEYDEEISDLEEYFATIGLIIQPDNELSGYHGVPSGSVLTNLVDCLIHRLAMLRLASRWGTELSEWSQVQGDDGVFASSIPLTSVMVDRAYAELGLEANAEKQFVGFDDALYLQRYHHISWAGGIYPTYRALNSLMGQERFHDPEVWGEDLVTLRAIMILENCKHHPLHTDIVRFVQSGDRLRLGAAYPGGIDALLGKPGLLSRARGLAGFVPSYNQENRLGGLKSFRTYQIVKEG